MNARGIPTAAYQVLHLLFCLGGGGYPIPTGGYPTLGTPHKTWLGTPLSDLAGVPPIWTWQGYPPIRPGQGTPPIRPGQGTPHQTWLGYLPSGPGWGTPPIWTWPGYPPPSGPGWGTLPHLDLAGVPPIISGWGTPHLDLAEVSPHQTWPGYPPSDLAGVPPIWTWLGFPPSAPSQGTLPPSGPGWGTLPHLHLAGVPFPICTWLGYSSIGPSWGTSLSGPGRGTPPPGCGQTNKLKLLPPSHPSDAVGRKFSFSLSLGVNRLYSSFFFFSGIRRQSEREVFCPASCVGVRGG